MEHDRRHLPSRLLVLRYGAMAVFAALGVTFWFLQVPSHQMYREMAENNHQRTLMLRAPRGMLFDRDGRVLVENRDAFTISLVREHTTDLDDTLRRLSAVLGADEPGLRSLVERHRRQPRYRPIELVPDASPAQLAALLARRLDFPDVIVEQVPTRRYPADDMGAHVFGYVGQVTEEQLARRQFGELRPGTIVGQAGLELSHNALLMGRDGARRVVVNSLGREIDTIGELPPEQGRRVMLTIDLDLQRAAEEAFRALDFRGAAVVLDPRNGEVLSMVSLPAFDPNLFVTGIDRAAWSDLNTDPLKPLQNRAIQGRYSPGSTFKLAVAVAALEEGIVTPDFRVTCRGAAVFYGRPFQCHMKGGHGSVDMRHAIEKSCNVYFYTLGNMLGIDRLHKWATALGLGVKTGIDLPHEVEGLMPSSEWKRRRTGERWYPGETISVAIGQGQVSVTPISLAVMMATIANGGTRHVPHLLKAVDEGRGWTPVQSPDPAAIVPMRPDHISALHEGLWLVINGAGTGRRGQIPGRDVAGKTGTAQVISLEGGRRAAGRTDKDLRDHGWFVFFAPASAPEIAGAVFAEHAEHGYLAAPIAKHVMETYFAKKEGRTLPPTPSPAPSVVVAQAAAAAPRAPGEPNE
jgi:penicillin-binding protein 2